MLRVKAKKENLIKTNKKIFNVNDSKLKKKETKTKTNLLFIGGNMFVRRVLLVTIVMVASIYGQVIDSFKWDYIEDSKSISQWIGELSLDGDKLQLNWIILRQKDSTVTLWPWTTGETMKIEFIQLSDDKSTLTFDLVFPLNRGRVRVVSKKNGEAWTYHGNGIIMNALSEGSVKTEIRSVKSINILGKEVKWKF